LAPKLKYKNSLPPLKKEVWGGFFKISPIPSFTKGGEKTALLLTIILSAAFFVAPKIILAQVVINEVAWMGTETSSANEWIELKNNSNNEVDLTGWQLLSPDGDIKIILGEKDKKGIINKKILPGEFYLLERTDDTSAPGAVADFIYAGALSDESSDTKSEGLRLYNDQSILIDEALANSGSNNKKWPAGDKNTKQTMERNNSGAWQNSQSPGGTPRAENSGSSSTTTPTPTTSSSPTSSSSPTPAPTKNFQYSQKVLINEFLPYPEKDAKEWLELLNTDSVAVDLTDWQINDNDNSTAPQLIPENTVIKPGEFLVVSFNKTTLNNDGDKVRLLWPDDQVIHVISYAKATQGQSATKITNGWVWTNQPTPGQTNKKSLFTNDSSENTSSATTEKISPIEESVLIGNEPASQAPSAPKISTPVSNGPEPISNTPKTTPSLNLTASANSAIKESSGLKNTLVLITVLLLAGLSALGLVYFRRKNQVDSPSHDD